MSSILKVDQLQDSGGNNLVTSNGSGVITAAGFGKVRQIIHTKSTSPIATSSNGVWTATGISVTITPSSTSSKILLLSTFSMYLDNPSGGQHACATLFRGGVSSGTNLGSGGQGLTQTYNTSVSMISTGGSCYMDEPATTAATTYEVGIRIQNAGTATARISVNSEPATINALEILP